MELATGINATARQFDPFFIELDRSGDEGYLGLIFASALGGLIGKLTTYAIGYFLSFRVTGTINRILHTCIALGNYRLTLPLCWIPWIGDLVTLWAGLNRSPVRACILYFLSMWAMSMLYYVAYRMFA